LFISTSNFLCKGGNALWEQSNLSQVLHDTPTGISDFLSWISKFSVYTKSFAYFASHPNPIEYADVVTSTTHKVLRGGRGGIILTNREDIIKKINSAVFPGYQGGPLMHIIAAKAVTFQEALQPSFKNYIIYVFIPT